MTEQIIQTEGLIAFLIFRFKQIQFDFFKVIL